MEIPQAPVASAVANRLSQARHTMEFGLHSAVLDEDAVIGGPVPINLAVEVVAIQALGGRKEVVVDIAGSWHIWQRKKGNDLRRNRINRNGCLIRKWRPPTAIGSPCGGIIYKGRSAKASKITAAKRLRRYCH